MKPESNVKTKLGQLVARDAAQAVLKNTTQYFYTEQEREDWFANQLELAKALANLDKISLYRAEILDVEEYKLEWTCTKTKETPVKKTKTSKPAIEI